MMSRLFATQRLHELWRCGHFVASCVTKRKSFLPLSLLRPHVLSRSFSGGRAAWQDATQPEGDRSQEMQTVDLDKWKSVMRSQVATEQKQQVDDEEKEDVSDDEDVNDDDGGNLKGESEGRSSLEATRDLVAMWRLAGRFVPQEMTDSELQTLADHTTKSAKKKYLKYLAIKEGHKMARMQKKQRRKVQREAEMEQRRGEDSDAEEGEGQRRQQPKNSFLLQFWSRSLDKLLAWRSAQAMVFGQPLVFDMSYDANMSNQELRNSVSQLMEVEGWNRRAVEPFHLHFCNLRAGGAYEKELINQYGAEAWDCRLLTTTHRQHVDVFPREQLVYLTADSPNVLRRFDHSKVYIIGAMVDRTIQSGLSLANAKRLKLATARLPLDEFLHWEMGAKNLTLDQMIRIMLTIKDTGSWVKALEFVPKRKHDGFHQQRTQKEMNNNRVSGNFRPREDGDRPFRSGERTFKNEGRNVYRYPKESGFSGRDGMTRQSSYRDNNPPPTRVRTSFMNKIEGRKGADKSRNWWDDE